MKLFVGKISKTSINPVTKTLEIVKENGEKISIKDLQVKKKKVKDTFIGVFPPVCLSKQQFLDFARLLGFEGNSYDYDYKKNNDKYILT